MDKPPRGAVLTIEITFASGVTGIITLTSGDLNITDNLHIEGPGAGILTISGNHALANTNEFGAKASYHLAPDQAVPISRGRSIGSNCPRFVSRSRLQSLGYGRVGMNPTKGLLSRSVMAASSWGRTVAGWTGTLSFQGRSGETCG